MNFLVYGPNTIWTLTLLARLDPWPGIWRKSVHAGLWLGPSLTLTLTLAPLTYDVRHTPYVWRTSYIWCTTYTVPAIWLVLICFDWWHHWWHHQWHHRLLTSDWLASCLQSWRHLFTVMMSRSLCWFTDLFMFWSVTSLMTSLHLMYPLRMTYPLRLTYDVSHWEKHELLWQCNIITSTNTERNMNIHGNIDS